MATFLELNDDALRAVLVRTCASDHPNLRLTCSRVRDAIRTPAFHHERCETGFAEVDVTIMSPFELYQEQMGHDSETSEADSRFKERFGEIGERHPHFGYQQNKARIHVDGKLAGKVSFHLLPRNNRNINFYTMCNYISRDVGTTGRVFFDSQGKPHLESVQKALENDSQTGFLYIESFEFVVPEYRSTTSRTGAKALRALLMDTSLKDRWSVAVYIPENRETEETRRTKRTLS